jgi:hypothetical protein
MSITIDSLSYLIVVNRYNSCYLAYIALNKIHALNDRMSLEKGRYKCEACGTEFNLLEELFMKIIPDIEDLDVAGNSNIYGEWKYGNGYVIIKR